MRSSMSELHFLRRSPAERNRLPIHMTAAVIGMEPHMVRQWLAKPLFGDRVQGLRQGRERHLDVGEAALLRLLAEHLPSTGSLKESWAAIGNLAQAIEPLADQFPPFPLDMFAVEAWSGVGLNKKGERYICIGRRELAQCIAERTVAERTRIYSIDVSRVLIEVATGWDIATLGSEQARLNFESCHLKRLLESRHGQALAMFDDLERRITEKRGPSASDTASVVWHVPANAA
jgi:hypothetical protein